MALSEDTDRDRSCTGKVRYKDRVTAEKVLKKLARSNGVPLGTYRVYRCRFCVASFHIGTRRQPLAGRAVAEAEGGDDAA